MPEWLVLGGFDISTDAVAVDVHQPMIEDDPDPMFAFFGVWGDDAETEGVCSACGEAHGLEEHEEFEDDSDSDTDFDAE
jgi:hypothetical protein